MAAGAVTPPALQPVSAPTAKERRYDRQLRLWAASGQQALEEAHLLLLNGGTAAVGTETLKNLVLPGVGAFTIVDPAVVREEDLGVNFFLEEESLGKGRAEECARLLVELNPDVKGRGIRQDLTNFVASTDLSSFTLVLVCGPATQAVLEYLRRETWKRSIPLFEVSCAGFYSAFSLQLPAQFPIVDTHPDPASTQDLRLLAPWPELSALVAYKTANLSEMSDHEHGHVPYLLLLLYYLDEWRSTHSGSLPTSYKDKTAFRDLVRSGARTANPEGGEENFDEAVAAVLKSLNEPTIPSGLKAIFAEPVCQSPQADSADFWFIAHAIARFVDAHGVLPLPGSIPDMKAQSEGYIELQNTYRIKARVDVAEVIETVRALEASLRSGSGKAAIDTKEIDAFCKGAAHVKLLHGRPRGEAAEDASGTQHPPPRWAHIAMQLGDEESVFPVLVAFEAMQSVLGPAPQTTAADIPGLMALAEAEESVAAMESFVDAYLDRVKAGADDDEFDVAKAKIRIMLTLQELQRSGPVELHNLASLTGGMVAQEAIKVITKQYVPIDNTCVFDGIVSRTGVFRL